MKGRENRKRERKTKAEKEGGRIEERSHRVKSSFFERRKMFGKVKILV